MTLRSGRQITDNEKAHYVVTRAIEKGILVRPQTCDWCSNTFGIVAHHHHGYSREHWLDVVWLCTTCHDREHRYSSMRRCRALNRLDEQCANYALKGSDICYMHT